jgi:SAM-dependent methyltransferase
MRRVQAALTRIFNVRRMWKPRGTSQTQGGMRVRTPAGDNSNSATAEGQAANVLDKRSQSFEEHLDRARRYIDVRNRAVLEIGSDRWLYVPKRLEELGAGRVEATNIVKGWPDSKKHSDIVSIRRADATRLSEVYAPKSFDLIFGMAVLEHIGAVWLLLEEMAKILKPGGILYLHGGGLWTCTRGHHLYTKYDGVEYKFTDSDCPIQSWEHLMLDEPGLRAALMSRGMQEPTAAHLAEFVYRSPDQNRFGYERLSRIFHAAPLKLIDKHETAFADPSAAELDRIRRGQWGDESHFNTTGVTFVMRR